MAGCRDGWIWRSGVFTIHRHHPQCSLPEHTQIHIHTTSLTPRRRRRQNGRGIHVPIRRSDPRNRHFHQLGGGHGPGFEGGDGLLCVYVCGGLGEGRDTREGGRRVSRHIDSHTTTPLPQQHTARRQCAPLPPSVPTRAALALALALAAQMPPSRIRGRCNRSAEGTRHTPRRQSPAASPPPPPLSFACGCGGMMSSSAAPVIQHTRIHGRDTSTNQRAAAAPNSAGQSRKNVAPPFLFLAALLRARAAPLRHWPLCVRVCAPFH